MISAGLLALLLMAIGRLRPLDALILGVLWASLHIQAYLEQRDSLPPGGLVTQISGAVDSFAYVEQGRQSFVMQLAASPAPDCRWLRHHSCGSRVLRMHSLWPQIVGADCTCACGIRYWRARFSRAIDAAGLEPAAAAIIKALAVADRSALNERQRRLLRATGVGHLLAISGLHISLCATWSPCVVRLLVALLGRHAQHYPAVRVGWIAALCYAALAGFGACGAHTGCCAWA